MEMDLTFDRNRIVMMWALGGHLDLTDFADLVRCRLLDSTKPGWDRHLTITSSRWTYDDLCPETQARVDLALTHATHTSFLGA